MPSREVSALSIVAVVNDPEWQMVRKSMIGNWVKNSELNVARLRAYLDETTWLGKTGWDCPLHIRRVLNVLVGTVHRVGHTANQPATDLLRKEVRTQWAVLCDEPIYMGSGAISEWGGTFA